MTELLTAPQVARLLGVTATTVRRWEADGLLHGNLTPGGHRRFDRLQVEHFKRNQGNPEDSTAYRLVDLMLDRDGPYALQGAMMELRGRLGSWWCVADELGEALAELGHQWETGARTVTQEHFATRQFQQVLWACIASLPSPPQQPACLLAAVDGEDHSLGLNLATLCLHEAGWNSIWLGSPTPSDVLLEAIGTYRPAMVAVTASAFSSDREGLETQYQNIADACRGCGAKLVLGGAGAWPDKPSRGHRVGTFADFAELLRRDR
jgi:MerR family transcriptional regulator, light-induced transcriptional regulator